jgi:hypothetical protein
MPLSRFDVKVNPSLALNDHAQIGPSSAVPVRGAFKQNNWERTQGEFSGVRGGVVAEEAGSENQMSDTFEFHVDGHLAEGSANGLVCAFALLIDVLESNGALKPKQFEQVLGAILRQPGMHTAEADVAVLEQIMGLLQAPDRQPLTVIAGGKA